MSRTFALVSVGELLADLIGTEFSENLIDTPLFERFQGGSPANLAANMARLGQKTALISAVGKDNLGQYLIQKVAETGVETAYISQSDEPTSIVLVSRTKDTPDFIAYRTADKQILPQHISDELLRDTTFFHTTCFALSQEPAQSTIIDAAKRAKDTGCIVSLDANYAPQIWPDRKQAQAVIAAYCANDAFIKLSEDDAERMFGEIFPHSKIIETLHGFGAKLVCLTLGAKGSIVSSDFGKASVQLEGKALEVKDATGAGDAYWSGFLTACIDGKNPSECADAGAKMASLKISTLGPLPNVVNKAFLY